MVPTRRFPPSCLGADVESRCVRPTGRAVLDGEACRHGGRDACGPYATSDRSPWTRAQLAPSAVPPPPGPDPPVSTQLPRARVIRKPKAECAMETVCVPWPSTWALDHQRFFAKWAFRDLVDCHELISFSLARSSSCAVCADGGRVNLSSELGYKRAQLTDGPGSGAFVNEAAISRDLRGGCPDCCDDGDGDGDGGRRWTWGEISVCGGDEVRVLPVRRVHGDSAISSADCRPCFCSLPTPRP